MIGDEWAKAAQEHEKAQQEIAKATGKGIDAVGATGNFLAKYLAGPFEEASLILRDRLRYRRIEQAVRFEQKTRDLLKASDVGGATRPIPLTFGVPLIEAATLEENDDLQTVWAQLLVNAAIAGGSEPRTAFVSMLKDMSPLDARILQMVVRAPADLMKDYIYTAGFPEDYTPPPKSSEERLMPSLPVETSLWNLARLMCVEPMQLISGRTVAAVYPTTLGKGFVKAVSRPGAE